MWKAAVRKRTNLSIVRNASQRMLRLVSDAPKDYRALSVAMSSVPLDGQIGEWRVRQDRREREAHERGERLDRDLGRIVPPMDDLL